MALRLSSRRCILGKVIGNKVLIGNVFQEAILEQADTQHRDMDSVPSYSHQQEKSDVCELGRNLI